MTPTRTLSKPAAFDRELRRLVLVCVIGAAMTILDSTIVNVALTPLGRQFGTTLPVIQWALTGYGLALAMVIPVTGWAVERFGAKTTWIASLVLFIVGSVLSGAAWNVGALIVFRALQGIGGGMVLPVGQIMLARKAGPDRMARVMGVVAIPTMIGPLLGPVIGGLIMDELSWRWMFYINVPLCAVALFLAARFLPPDTRGAKDPGRRFDRTGLILLSPGMAFCVYGLSEADANPTRFALWTAAGVICLAAYVVHEHRTDNALVSLAAFKRRAFAMSTVTMVIYLAAVYGFIVLLPVYFQVVRGVSPMRAGLLLAPLILGAGITMALCGWLAHRISARWIIIPGMLVVAVGAAWFTRLTPASGVLLVVGVLLFTSLGHGAILPIGTGTAYQGMPKAEIPSATATFNVVFRVASSIGTALFATILQVAVRNRIPGTTSLAAAKNLHDPGHVALLTSAFRVSFWCVAAVTLAAVIPAFFLPGKANVSMTSMLVPGGDDDEDSDEAEEAEEPATTGPARTR